MRDEEGVKGRQGGGAAPATASEEEDRAQHGGREEAKSVGCALPGWEWMRDEAWLGEDAG
jgi:hypothetical protein